MLLLLVAMAPACEMASPNAPTSTVGGATGLDAATATFSTERGHCADEINRYRAVAGRPALHRSESLETFAATAAATDGASHVAHQYFKATNGGGTAVAETEILWWRGFAVTSVIEKGLAQMWQAGPGGEHYEILVGPYSEVGCGVFVNGAEVTVTQDFR